MRYKLATAVFSALAVLSIAPSAANAAPQPSAGQGSQILIKTGKDTASCTVAAVGTDNTGGKVAITAGHCGKVGDTVTTSAGTKIGTFSKSKDSGNLDYGVVALNPSVLLSNQSNLPKATGSTAPHLGKIACKFGRTTGQTCGAILSVSNNDFSTYGIAYFGDSGGPALIGDKLVGIVSHSQSVPVATPTFYTRVDKALADINAAGGSGAGFKFS